MSPRVSKAGDFEMANMTMAKAVLEHAHQFYNVSTWYVVAECWDELAVLEELDRVEEVTRVPFQLEDSAIAHFAGIVEVERFLD
jgi:predicted metal-dependent TIM-barrel fold hydrolase